MDKEPTMPRSEKPGVGSGSSPEGSEGQLPEYERRFREDVARGGDRERIIALTAWWGRFGHDDTVPQENKDRVADVLTELRGGSRQSRGSGSDQGYQPMSDDDIERSRLRLMVDSEGRPLGDPQIERMLTIRAVENELARQRVESQRDETENDPPSQTRQAPSSGQQGTRHAGGQARAAGGDPDVVDGEYDEILSDGTRVHHEPGGGTGNADQGRDENSQEDGEGVGDNPEREIPEWAVSFLTLWRLPKNETRVEVLTAWLRDNATRFGVDIPGGVAEGVAEEIQKERDRINREREARNQQQQNTRDARRREQDRQEREAERGPEGELDPLDDVLLDPDNAGRLARLARGYQRGAPQPMWDMIRDVIEADAESRRQTVDRNRLRAMGENRVWSLARDIYLGRLAGPEAVAIREQIVREVGGATPNVERINGLNQRLNEALGRGFAEWQRLSQRRMMPELVEIVDRWIHRGTEAPRVEVLPQDVDEVRASVTRLVQAQLKAKPGKIGADDQLYAHVGLVQGPFAAQAIPEKLCIGGAEITPSQRNEELERLKLWVSVLRQMHDIMVDVRPPVTGGAQDLYKPWAEKLDTAKKAGNLESFSHNEYELFAQFEIRTPDFNFTIEGKDFAAQQMMVLARLAEGDPRRMGADDQDLYNRLGLARFNTGTFDPAELIRHVAGLRFRNSRGQEEPLNDFTARRVYEFLEMHQWRSRLGPNGGMKNPLAGGEQFGKWGEDGKEISIAAYVHRKGFEIGNPRRVGDRKRNGDGAVMSLEHWIPGLFKNGMLNVEVNEGTSKLNGYQLAEGGRLFSTIARKKLREAGTVTPLSAQWEQVINSLPARELYLATLGQPDKAIGKQGGMSGIWIGNMLSIDTAVSPYGKEAVKRAKLVALGFAAWDVSLDNPSMTLEGMDGALADRVRNLRLWAQELVNSGAIFGDYMNVRPEDRDTKFTKRDVDWFIKYVNTVREEMIRKIDQLPIDQRPREQGMVRQERHREVVELDTFQGMTTEDLFREYGPFAIFRLGRRGKR